jgi:hypothetical protein
VSASSDQVYGNQLSGEHLGMWVKLCMPNLDYPIAGVITDIRHTTAMPSMADVTLRIGDTERRLALEVPAETIVRFEPKPRG